MGKIRYLTNSSITNLRGNLYENSHFYNESPPWLEKFFEGKNWYGEATQEMPSIDLKMPEGTELFDLENTKIIYSKLKNLPLTLAIDERFWAYLTHVVFWDYMRARWPLGDKKDKKKTEEYLRTRYLFMPNPDRRLVRNGISRLWWYGHVSYDASRTNPFELTKALLYKKLDVAQSLLERSYSRNKTITKTILSMLVEKEAAGTPFSDRPTFRPLVMHLNGIGGVTMLDSLVEDDIRNIVENKLVQLERAASKEFGTSNDEIG